MNERPGSRLPARIVSFVGEDASVRHDQLATEEPLEVRLAVEGRMIPVGLTMRTPGNDFELALGLLFAEGIVRHPNGVQRISYCVDRAVGEQQRLNIVNVAVAPGAVDLGAVRERAAMTSACGVCGKTTIDDLEVRGYRVAAGPLIPLDAIYRLPDALREAQDVFGLTGGLHAAGLFDVEGSALIVREDIGRHNATDKAIGWALVSDDVDLAKTILMVSGRAGFEIVQKAVAASIPVVCSVSAPSSLAVSVAQRFDVTLIGFLRDGRFNVYSGAERIAAPVPAR